MNLALTCPFTLLKRK
jgi:hypothetical protein